MWMSFRQRSVLQLIYTALAPAYGPLTVPFSSQARATGRRWLNVTDGDHVLDVGCGPGRDFRRFAAATPSGWTAGLDATPAMLSQARRRASALSHARYALRRGDARALPYADDRFDALFSAYLVDLLPAGDLRQTFEEFRRVLRPYGRAVLVTMAFPKQSLGRLWAAASRWAPPLLGGSRPVAVRGPLREAGFRILRRTVQIQGGLPSAVVEVKPTSPPSSSN